MSQHGRHNNVLRQAIPSVNVPKGKESPTKTGPRAGSKDLETVSVSMVMWRKLKKRLED